MKQHKLDFSKELDYFIKNQEILVKKYQGRILVLRNQSVVDSFPDYFSAYLGAQRKYPLGTFMLQQCIPGEEAYTVTINSTRISA